jgi:tetratricopeptide (TPR) repeat protein
VHQTVKWPAAAIMVHTETAFRLWSDGRREAADLHLRIAPRWHAGSPARFVRRWYLAVVAFFQSQFDLERARKYVDGVQQISPGDADVAVARGMLDEATVSPRVAPVGPTTHGSPAADDFQLNRAVGRQRDFLSRAERAYREAMALDTSHEEAALRLGRVLSLMQRTDEAMPLLQHMQQRTSDGYLRYLSSIFLARIHEQRGQLEHAEEHYAAAIRLYPTAQAASLGLAFVRFKRGQRGAAGDTVKAMLSPARGERTDPWWLYDLGYASQLSDWMRELWNTAQQ